MRTGLWPVLSFYFRSLRMNNGTPFEELRKKEVMSKQDIYKILSSPNMRLILIFLFAAVAGIFLILSLPKLWF